ncbi:MAG: DUF4339 domain-containing protein [Planctomycetes bacterium]|nr:DUF4339 domain-containing protein [Planctomycetota bacterium]
MSEELPPLYTRVRGQVQGPFTFKQLRSLVLRGRVSRHNELSEDGVEWIRASEFPDLFQSRVSAKVRTAQPELQPQPEPQLQLAPAEAEADELVVEQPTADDGTVWHYEIGSDQHGPISKPELLELIRSGQLQPESCVWTPGWPDWAPVESVADLAAAAGAQPGRGTPATQQPAASTGKTSPMAILSLVISLVAMLFLCLSSMGIALLESSVLKMVMLGLSILLFVGSILAAVFGHLALGQIREGFDGKPLAITGLVVSYGTIAVSVVVFAVVIIIKAVS